VKLSKDHDHTEGDCKTGEDEEGPAEVLVTSEAIGVEGSALVHVHGEGTILPHRTVAVMHAPHAIIGLTEVVSGEGDVVKMEVLLTSRSISAAKTSLESLELLVSLHDQHLAMGSPLEVEKLMGTSPETSAAESLIISECDLADICSVPLEKLARSLRAHKKKKNVIF